MPATMTLTRGPRLRGHCSNCGQPVVWNQAWEAWEDEDTAGFTCVAVDADDDDQPVYDVHDVEPGEEDTSDFDDGDVDEEEGW